MMNEGGLQMGHLSLRGLHEGTSKDMFSKALEWASVPIGVPL